MVRTSPLFQLARSNFDCMTIQWSFNVFKGVNLALNDFIFIIVLICIKTSDQNEKTT